MEAVYKVINNHMVLISRTCREYNEEKEEYVEGKCN